MLVLGHVSGYVRLLWLTMHPFGIKDMEYVALGDEGEGKGKAEGEHDFSRHQDEEATMDEDEGYVPIQLAASPFIGTTEAWHLLIAVITAAGRLLCLCQSTRRTSGAVTEDGLGGLLLMNMDFHEAPRRPVLLKWLSSALMRDFLERGILSSGVALLAVVAYNQLTIYRLVVVQHGQAMGACGLQFGPNVPKGPPKDGVDPRVDPSVDSFVKAAMNVRIRVPGPNDASFGAAEPSFAVSKTKIMLPTTTTIMGLHWLAVATDPVGLYVRLLDATTQELVVRYDVNAQTLALHACPLDRPLAADLRGGALAIMDDEASDVIEDEPEADDEPGLEETLRLCNHGVVVDPLLGLFRATASAYVASRDGYANVFRLLASIDIQANDLEGERMNEEALKGQPPEAVSHAAACLEDQEEGAKLELQAIVAARLKTWLGRWKGLLDDTSLYHVPGAFTWIGLQLFRILLACTRPSSSGATMALHSTSQGLETSSEDGLVDQLLARLDGIVQSFLIEAAVQPLGLLDDSMRKLTHLLTALCMHLKPLDPRDFRRKYNEHSLAFKIYPLTEYPRLSGTQLQLLARSMVQARGALEASLCHRYVSFLPVLSGVTLSEEDQYYLWRLIFFVVKRLGKDSRIKDVSTRILGQLELVSLFPEGVPALFFSSMGLSLSEAWTSFLGRLDDMQFCNNLHLSALYRFFIAPFEKCVICDSLELRHTADTTLELCFPQGHQIQRSSLTDEIIDYHMARKCEVCQVVFPIVHMASNSIFSPVLFLQSAAATTCFWCASYLFFIHD